MDKEIVKKVILDSRHEIKLAVAKYTDCKDYLLNELGKTQSYIDEFSSIWKYAFDNVSSWDKVIENFSSKIEGEKITLQQNISIAVPTNQNPKIGKTFSQEKKPLTQYHVIENADIIIDFFDKLVFGINFFF